MITFGVIKGFLRRVYCYPVWLDHPVFGASSANPQGAASLRHRSKAIQGAHSDEDEGGTRQDGVEVPPNLPGMLDGKHHTDELCLKFHMGFKKLREVLAVVGGADKDAEPEELGRVELLYL